jgi:hypothetical protein
MLSLDSVVDLLHALISDQRAIANIFHGQLRQRGNDGKPAGLRPLSHRS